MRASSRDHLDALARALHPHRGPVWSWDRPGYVWLPAWEDPELQQQHWPTLGDDWDDAAGNLEAYLARAQCDHGTPLAARCGACARRLCTTLGRPQPSRGLDVEGPDR